MRRQIMRPRIILISLVIAIILVVNNPAYHFKSLAAPAQKSWTYMVYLDADNNLESAGMKDFNEMESVGSTSDVNIVVQMDRIPSYDDTNGDWTGTRRYYVTKDSDLQIVHSTLIQDLGEVNMGASAALSSFVEWAISDYPAARYALVLWDHGSGYPGVCFDDTNNGDYLTMRELKQVLSAVKTATGFKMDVLSFDACLMGMIEVAHQVKDYVNFMVASEESEPNDGTPYDTVLNVLAQNPAMSASQLASTTVTKYITSYTDGLPNPDDAPTVTDAAYDLAKETVLADAVSNLAEALIGGSSQYKSEIASAKMQSEVFYGGFVDLYDFTQRIRNSIVNITIQSAVDDVLAKVTDFVIAEGHGSSHPNSHGVTIYYPDKYDRVSYTGSEDEKALDFPWDTRWDDFLDFGVNVNANLTPQFDTYTVPGNTTIAQLAQGDVDGDGTVEVIAGGHITDTYGHVHLLIIVCKVTDQELVTQSNYTVYLGEDEELTSMDCADSDNDAKDEIILTANFYNLTDYEWYACMIILSGEGDQISLQAYDESTDISLESLAIKDVDTDGYNEIVFSGHLLDEFGNEYAYVAVGNNSSPEAITLEDYYAWNIGTEEDLRAVAVEDTDGDGFAEIVVGGVYYDSTYGVWYGYVAVLNFTQNLFWLQAYDYGQNIWINSLKIADVNGDNTSEIVVSGYSWDTHGTYYFYIGIGINRPSNEVNWLYQDAFSIGEDEELSSVDVADVDGDGIAEIIVCGYYYNATEFEWNAYQAVFSWSNTTGMVLENAYYGEVGNEYTYSTITANVDNDTQPEVISCDTLEGHVDTSQINVETASNYVPETGTLTGTVTAGGIPVSGATVTVAKSRYSEVATTTTFPNGSYVIELQTGSYEVEVSAPGKLNTTETGVLIYAGQTSTVSLELQNVPIASNHVLTVNGLSFQVSTVSNSTISSLEFDKDQKEISFNVTETSGTKGFCNVTIPIILLGGNFTVKIDGLIVTPDPIVVSNATHSFVYFTYTHSSHMIQILGTTAIPEFSTSTTLAMLLGIILVAAALMKRKYLSGRVGI